MKKTNFLIIALVLVLIVSVWLIAQTMVERLDSPADPPPLPSQGPGWPSEGELPADLSKQCEDTNGRWLEAHSECEFAGQEWCLAAGGDFSECESACRHDPDATACTRQCVSVCAFAPGDGAELCHDDLICLRSPLPGETVSSPLAVRGRARGNWYFEASFPLVLTNWDGLIIAESYASALGEWMTEDFVEFEGFIEFSPDTSVSRRGALILQKDNPSGLPQHDNALEIDLLFE